VSAGISFRVAPQSVQADSFPSRSRVARLSVGSRPVAWRTALLIIGPSLRQALPRGRPARRVRVAGEPVVAASRSDSDGASALAMLQPPDRTFASSPWPRGPSTRKSATLRRHAVAGARRGQCRPEETLLSSRRSGAPIAGLAAGSSIRVVPSAARAVSAISASACVNTRSLLACDDQAADENAHGPTGGVGARRVSSSIACARRWTLDMALSPMTADCSAVSGRRSSVSKSSSP
jgi:hypothetical protein